jgi:hypothetical protein
VLKGLMVTSVTKGGGTQKLPKQLLKKLSKHTDMTIYWKALEEHFLMVPLVFQFIFGENAFSEFFSKRGFCKTTRHNVFYCFQTM